MTPSTALSLSSAASTRSSGSASSTTTSTDGSSDNNKRIFLPDSFYPDDHVWIGRGRRVDTHPGNLRYRTLIHAHLEAYSLAPTKSKKSAIILEVFNQVVATGGFVKQDASTKRWFRIEDAAARISIAQAFRDALSHEYKSSKQYKQKKRHAIRSGRGRNVGGIKKTTVDNESVAPNGTGITPAVAGASCYSPEFFHAFPSSAFTTTTKDFPNHPTHLPTTMVGGPTSGLGGGGGGGMASCSGGARKVTMACEINHGLSRLRNILKSATYMIAEDEDDEANEVEPLLPQQGHHGMIMTTATTPSVAAAAAAAAASGDDVFASLYQIAFGNENMERLDVARNDDPFEPTPIAVTGLATKEERETVGVDNPSYYGTIRHPSECMDVRAALTA